MQSSTNSTLQRSVASPSLRPTAAAAAAAAQSQASGATSTRHANSKASTSHFNANANNDASDRHSNESSTPRRRSSSNADSTSTHSADLRRDFGISSSRPSRSRAFTDEDEHHVKGHKVERVSFKRKLFATLSALANFILIALLYSHAQSPLVCPAPPELQSLVTRSAQQQALLAGESLDNLDLPNDLSANRFQASKHEKNWNYCPLGASDAEDAAAQLPQLPNSYCSELPENEQGWQVGWYGGQVAVGAGKSRRSPDRLKCAQLPPPGYKWPSKHKPLPFKEDGVHWPNLRVEKLDDLIRFNRGTPKNLYHFNAPVYDLDGLDEAKFAAPFIPFGTKVRNVLDIGAGGGSLGLVLKQKYDLLTMSIIFPDWCYCEYITERGNLCVLVDVMEAMPFAKWTWDVIHVSWVYHGQQPDELVEMYLELNRVLRPGGYIWQRGGWSQVQVDAMRALFIQLGYKPLYDKEELKPKGVSEKISFGENLPYTTDWTCVWVKPSVGEALASPDCANTKPVTMPVAGAAAQVAAAANAAAATVKSSVASAADALKDSTLNAESKLASVASKVADSVQSKVAQVQEAVASKVGVVADAGDKKPV